VFALLLGLVLVAMGAWMYGRYEHWHGAWRSGIALLLAVLGLVVAWPGAAPAGDAVATAQEELGWQPWSPEKVRELTAAGHPVFVDFTAAWCVTCQVNKRLVLDTDAVRDAFRRQNVALLRADWTRRDPAIGAALTALGRNGVPVYVFFRPGKEPLLLPEVLTRQDILDAVDMPQSATSRLIPSTGG